MLIFILVGSIPLVCLYYFSISKPDGWQMTALSSGTRSSVLIVILIALVYLAGLVLIPPFLGEKLADGKGQARFYPDHVEISLKSKRFDIPYHEIKEVTYTPIKYVPNPMGGGGLRRGHFKLRANTQHISLKTTQTDVRRAYAYAGIPPRRQNPSQPAKLQNLYDQIYSHWKSSSIAASQKAFAQSPRF